MSLIPEKITNFKVYLNGEDLIGIASVTLPTIEAVTSTVKGAGIAGEYESPTLGHFKSMRLGLKWNVMNSGVAILNKQESHALELHAVPQVNDTASGKLLTPAVKIRVNGYPIKLETGKLEMGSTMDTQIELEVTYFNLTINKEDRIEIDKLNFIHKVMGEDMLAPIREALGMIGDNSIVESATNKLRSITGI